MEVVMLRHKSTNSFQKKLISAYPNIISELDVHTGYYLSSKVSSHQNEMLVLGILLSVLQQKGQVAIRVSELLDKTFGEHLDTIASTLIDYEDRNSGSSYFLGSSNPTETDERSKETDKLDILGTKLTKNVLDGFVKSRIIGDVNSANYETMEIQFPLVRQGDWLYLSRYWEAERTIVFGIVNRLHGFSAAVTPQSVHTPQTTDNSQPSNELVTTEQDDVSGRSNPGPQKYSKITSDSPNPTTDLQIEGRIHHYLHDTEGRTESQIVAVKTALKDRFTIITGGPGTGKTRCITTLLAVLLEFNPAQRVALAAPTGKAAARMMESISQNLDALQIPQTILHYFPKNATTLHRLIGWNPGTGKALYDKNHRLELDLLIIDEASMVDLAMMARVFKALPSSSRIILLGDKDQLSSVEAGAVFGEITKTLAELQAEITKTLAGLQADITISESDPLATSTEKHPPSYSNYNFMVNLNHSWRFSEESRLSDLSKLINTGDGNTSWQLLLKGGLLGVMNPKQTNLLDAVLPRINEIHNKLIHQIEQIKKGEHGDDAKEEIVGESSQGVNELFKTLKSFQNLSAHRRGFGGSVMLNAKIDKKLSEKIRKTGDKSLISEDGDWYIGRPVIVTQNDYNLGLFNGDVGITITLDGRLVVTFGVDPKTNRLKVVAPSQLYNIESAWVITVHKSQGSEFENVLLVMPDEMSPVLTRELIYTAVTRARNRVQIYGHETVWKEAVQQQSGRYSGIGEMLSQLLEA